MRFQILFFILILLGFVRTPGNTQETEENIFVVSLFNNLYSLRFQDATEDLKEITKANISQDTKDICIANYYWWHIVTHEESSTYKTKMLAALDGVLARHQESPLTLTNPDVVFAIGHAYAYKTRLDMHEGDYLKGAKNLNMAGKYLDLILPRAEEDIKYTLLAGLYHYIAGSILDRYPVLRPLFIGAPDIIPEKGLRYLEQCSQDPHPFISIEASYFIMRVNSEVTRDYDKANQIVSMLLQKFPGNIYFSSYKICALADDKKKAEALREYNNLRNNKRSDQISRAQYNFIIGETENYLRKKRIKI